MRKFINVFFVAAGLMFTVNMAHAQQKFGHFSSEEVYVNYSPAKDAQAKLENLQKEKQGQLDGMTKEYQTKYAEAQAKEKTLSEANKEVVIKELQTMGEQIQDLEKRINEARAKAQQDIAAKSQELLQPIQAKVLGAVQSVAKEKGLAYVFDINGGGVVYWDGGEDITAAIKAKLGITTSTPAPKK